MHDPTPTTAHGTGGSTSIPTTNPTPVSMILATGTDCGNRRNHAPLDPDRLAGARLRRFLHPLRGPLVAAMTGMGGRNDRDPHSAANRQELAPEDALVIAEMLLRLKNAVADIPCRADGALNHHDLWRAYASGCPADPRRVSCQATSCQQACSVEPQEEQENVMRSDLVKVNESVKVAGLEAVSDAEIRAALLDLYEYLGHMPMFNVSPEERARNQNEALRRVEALLGLFPAPLERPEEQ